MKAHISWSYKPYKPLFFETGDIYICRVEPHATTITFDWLSIDAESYNVYCRTRYVGEFECVATTSELTYTITGLKEDVDYEFYVEADGKKSRVRLAHCGEAVGTIVNYLHPEDMAYSFSGRYLASPSIVRHPDGHLLASMDLFAWNHPQNLTLIYRSDDNGKTWYHLCELFPCFWGRMFIHKGEVYMLSVATEYGDLLIGKSSDGGATWTEPTVLLRGSNGKNGEPGVHKNPQPVVEYNGRLWATTEYGSYQRAPLGHPMMVMSAPVDSDLLCADNWLFSEPLPYDPDWKELPPSTVRGSGGIEGCLVTIRGGLYSLTRFDMSGMTPGYGKVMAFKVNTDDPEAQMEFAGCIDFPSNNSKFVIKYNEERKKFYSVVTRISCKELAHRRNLLSLMSSVDGEHWELVRDIYDYRNEDSWFAGFQYADWIFEGDEILFVCRTGLNNPNDFHNTNYQTFDRVKLD